MLSCVLEGGVVWIGGGEVSKASVSLSSPFSLLTLFFFPFFLNTALKANASDKRQAFARKERLVLAS